MKTAYSIISSRLKTAEDTYDMTPFTVKAIVLLPILIVFLYSFFFLLPMTRLWAETITEENGPVELLTFGFLLLGALLGLVLAWRARKHGEGFLVVGFYAVFSLALLIIGMEEVAWGQLLLGFEPPEALISLNVKGEMTIHNIEGFDSNTESLRLVFGLGGLLGVWLSHRRSFRKIGAPAILSSWFVCITILAAVDLYDDFYQVQGLIYALNERLSEVVEMMIGMTGLLFIWLNGRFLANEWKQNVSKIFGEDNFEPSATSLRSRTI